MCPEIVNTVGLGVGDGSGNPVGTGCQSGSEMLGPATLRRIWLNSVPSTFIIPREAGSWNTTFCPSGDHVAFLAYPKFSNLASPIPSAPTTYASRPRVNITL